MFKPGKWIDNIQEQIAYIDAIELPAKDISQIIKYTNLAKSLAKPIIAGSDSHTWIQLGIGVTEIHDKECHDSEFNLKYFKQAIQNNQINHKISPDAQKFINMSAIYRKNFMV